MFILLPVFIWCTNASPNVLQRYFTAPFDLLLRLFRRVEFGSCFLDWTYVTGFVIFAISPCPMQRLELCRKRATDFFLRCEFILSQSSLLNFYSKKHFSVRVPHQYIPWQITMCHVTLRFPFIGLHRSQCHNATAEITRRAFSM